MSTTTSTSLGQFIKNIRTGKHLSQEDVANAAGLARSYISRLEDDQFKTPSAMVLIRLAKGLGVSHDALFLAAGYLPHIEKGNLPPFDAYLRTKFPRLSEEGIKELEFYKNYIEQKYKNKEAVGAATNTK